MKTIFRTAAIAALIMTASCGKDTAEDTIADVFEEAEQLEETVLDVDELTDGVLIEGATENDGTPPEANGAITLNIGDSGKTAFLNEGFNVELQSDSDFEGVYLRFKDKDGTVADSYYDIDLSTNGDNFKKETTFLKRNRKENRSLTSKTGYVTLDVDFSGAIEPGTFCYEICVYDAEGNISLPQEVCATVQSWGGNTALIGEWEATKFEYVDDRGTDIEVVGEEDCSTSSVTCSELNQEIEFEECSIIDFENIVFNEDGTYVLNFQTTNNDLNYTASTTACEAILKEVVVKYDSWGFWAYDIDSSRLTLVEYRNEESEGDDSFSGTNEEGDADLFYDGILSINNNDMIINEKVDSDLDGVIDYDDKYYYTKK